MDGRVNSQGNNKTTDTEFLIDALIKGIVRSNKFMRKEYDALRFHRWYRKAFVKMTQPHIWQDRDGDKVVEWIWPSGRLGIAQNGDESDSWYLAAPGDDGGECRYGDLPTDWINWDAIKVAEVREE